MESKLTDHIWTIGELLATLAAILGHSNLRSIMRYVHPTQEHQRAAMHRFGVEEEIHEPRSETLDSETIQ